MQIGLSRSLTEIDEPPFTAGYQRQDINTAEVKHRTDNGWEADLRINFGVASGPWGVILSLVVFNDNGTREMSPLVGSPSIMETDTITLNLAFTGRVILEDSYPI